jgi:heme/copper-type cytochrome/quinol oxidase subunit 2
MSEWALPIAIILTVIALLLYFSPRFLKKKNQQAPETPQQ